MNQSIQELAPASNLTTQAYLQIRGEILACRLRPGEKLTISTLCRDFGFSLGAVREALSRLSAEGLVEAEPNKGFRVAPITQNELEDLTRTRVLVETECLVSSIASGNLKWESGVVSSHFELTRIPLPSPEDPRRINPEWVEAHRRFHEALVAACDSRWLLRIREMLYAQSERYRSLSVPADESHRDLLAEHKAIADAALARDVEAASSLMRAHVMRTTQILIGAGLVDE